MSELPVDAFVFNFQGNVIAEKYDNWVHYRLVWNAGNGQKAMDVVAVESSQSTGKTTTWLIEAKDFRVITNPPKPSNISGLAQLVADKSFDTLAGLRHAAAHATTVSEHNHAANATASAAMRIVLHLEPHSGRHTALFPSGFAANVLQKLRQCVKSIDPNPLVLSITNTVSAGVPWTVT